MHCWKQWVPKEENYYLMAANCTHLYENSLMLKYINRDMTKNILFQFEKGFLLLRTTEDSSFEQTLKQVVIRKPEGENIRRKDWPLFIVINSNFVKFFKNTAMGIYDKERIIHYVIVSYDNITEILSTLPPKIVISEDK